jgi:hypothetical protein
MPRIQLHALALVLLVLGCGSSSEPQAPTPPAEPEVVARARRGPVVRFAYETIDGKQLSTESVAGRFTVIGFLTTYDFASQAEARFLAAVARRHAPRVNVAALILENPDNRPLAEAFVKTLGLSFPTAMADAATIAGQGPFAGLHHVPSIVILDKQGREAYRHLGLIQEAKIHEVLRELEASGDTRP